MARTIRRKNARWASFGNYTLMPNTSKYGGSYYEYVYYDKDSVEDKKFWNLYHSDKNRGQNGVPGWYVNMNFQRPLRQKSKQLLKKYNGEEDLMFPEYFRSAGYDWY